MSCAQKKQARTTNHGAECVCEEVGVIDDKAPPAYHPCGTPALFFFFSDRITLSIPPNQ